MVFTETSLNNAYIIDPDFFKDQRGFFARSWCKTEFEKHGLNPNLSQCNISFNNKKGTLRGMHLQTPPYEEAKLIRCTMGAIFDVIIDLRRNSETYKQWFSTELTAKNRKMLYVPEGFAHGFQTLEDNTEVFYQMSEFFHPECNSGVRYNDKAFGIEWPITDPYLSAKDSSWEDFLL